MLTENLMDVSLTRGMGFMRQASSPNNLMGFMMDALSCQSRDRAGEINDINDGCFNLGELVPDLWYCAFLLIDLACCDT